MKRKLFFFVMAFVCTSACKPRVFNAESQVEKIVTDKNLDEFKNYYSTKTPSTYLISYDLEQKKFTRRTCTDLNKPINEANCNTDILTSNADLTIQTYKELINNYYAPSKLVKSYKQEILELNGRKSKYESELARLRKTSGIPLIQNQIADYESEVEKIESQIVSSNNELNKIQIDPKVVDKISHDILAVASTPGVVDLNSKGLENTPFWMRRATFWLGHAISINSNAPINENRSLLQLWKDALYMSVTIPKELNGEFFFHNNKIVSVTTGAYATETIVCRAFSRGFEAAGLWFEEEQKHINVTQGRFTALITSKVLLNWENNASISFVKISKNKKPAEQFSLQCGKYYYPNSSLGIDKSMAKLTIADLRSAIGQVLQLKISRSPLAPDDFSLFGTINEEGDKIKNRD